MSGIGQVYSTACCLAILQLDNGTLPIYQQHKSLERQGRKRWGVSLTASAAPDLRPTLLNCPAAAGRVDLLLEQRSGFLPQLLRPRAAHRNPGFSRPTRFSHCPAESTVLRGVADRLVLVCRGRPCRRRVQPLGRVVGLPPRRLGGCLGRGGVRLLAVILIIASRSGSPSSRKVLAAPASGSARPAPRAESSLHAAVPRAISEY